MGARVTTGRPVGPGGPTGARADPQRNRRKNKELLGSQAQSRLGARNLIWDCAFLGIGLSNIFRDSAVVPSWLG